MKHKYLLPRSADKPHPQQQIQVITPARRKHPHTKHRLDNVVDRLIQHYLSKQWLIICWIAQFVGFRKKPEILDKASAYINADLKKVGIMK